MSKTLVSILRLTLCLGAMVFSLVAVNGIEDWRLWAIGTAALFVATQAALGIFWDIIEEKAHIKRAVINEMGRLFRGIAE